MSTFNEFNPAGREQQGASFAETLKRKLADASPDLAGLVQGNKLVVDLGRIQDAQVSVVVSPNKSKIVSLTVKF
jgi:hypothetical protein